MNIRSLCGLIAIISASWILILAETYIFFGIIRPLGPPLHSNALISSSLKVLLTGGLGALWVVVMFAMLALYFRSMRNVPT